MQPRRLIELAVDGLLVGGTLLAVYLLFVDERGTELQRGTFLAVLALMRADVWRLLKAFFGSIRRRKIQTQDEKLAWLLLISTIPAGIVGVAFESFIEDKLGQPWLMAILIIGFYVWLYRRSAQGGLGGMGGAQPRAGTLNGGGARSLHGSTRRGWRGRSCSAITGSGTTRWAPTRGATGCR